MRGKKKKMAPCPMRSKSSELGVDVPLNRAAKGRYAQNT